MTNAKGKKSSGLMEKLVRGQLINCFEKNELLGETQSEFRSYHNCESLIKLVMRNSMQSRKGKKPLCAANLMVDFKGAFAVMNRLFILL